MNPSFITFEHLKRAQEMLRSNKNNAPMPVVLTPAEAENLKNSGVDISECVISKPLKSWES